MIRTLAPLVLLAGCYSTVSYRAADPDTLDDDQAMALESCQARCRLADDDAACFAGCPTVSRRDGGCADSDLPPALCYERTATDVDALRAGIGLAGATAAVVLGVLYVRGMIDAAEAAADTTLAPAR